MASTRVSTSAWPEVRLIVPWAQVETFLDDEARYAELKKVQEEPVDRPRPTRSTRRGSGPRHPERLSFDGGSERRPILLEIKNFEELEPNIPISRQELLNLPGAFVDGHGTLHAGQDAAMEIARRYCQAQPERLIERGRQELERVRRAVVTGWYEPRLGRSHERWQVNPDRVYDWLRETEQTWAIIGSWCGEQVVDEFQEREALRGEVERLQKTLQSTVDWLKRNGHPVKAGLLEHELASREKEAD